MGVHHFTLKLIPKAFLDKHQELTKHPWSNVDIDMAEDIKSGCWSSNQPSNEMLGLLRKILPIDNSLIIHGVKLKNINLRNHWGSDVRIWKETDGTVWDITLRFSPVEKKYDVLKKYIEIANVNNCILFNQESSKLLEADYDLILKNIKKSNAEIFKSDPIVLSKKVLIDQKTDNRDRKPL